MVASILVPPSMSVMSSRDVNSHVVRLRVFWSVADSIEKKPVRLTAPQKSSPGACAVSQPWLADP